MKTFTTVALVTLTSVLSFNAIAESKVEKSIILNKSIGVLLLLNKPVCNEERTRMFSFQWKPEGARYKIKVGTGLSKLKSNCYYK